MEAFSKREQKFAGTILVLSCLVMYLYIGSRSKEKSIEASARISIPARAFQPNFVRPRQQQLPEYRADQLIVEFAPSASPAAKARVIKSTLGAIKAELLTALSEKSRLSSGDFGGADIELVTLGKPKV